MANRTLTTLTAVLQMNNSKFKKGLSGSQKAMKGFSNQIQKIGGMIAGAFAVGSIVRFGKEAFKLLDVQAKAERSLLVSLNGRISAQQTLITQAKTLQKVTLYGDEETIRAAALVGTMVKEEETIKRLIPLIQDFATAKNMQLSAAADLVAKSIGSSTNALSRYGLTITGSVGSAERLETAVNALSTAFGGQAEAAADADKALTQVKNAWGDLQEQFASWISEGEGGFVRRGLLGGIEDITKLFEKSQNPKALAAFKEFYKTIKDRDAATQAALLTEEVERQKKAVADLAKTRREQQKIVEEGGHTAKQFAKTEIEKIDEKQTAILEVVRVLESERDALKGINEEVEVEVKTRAELFKAWVKENDLRRNAIELQEKLNDLNREGLQTHIDGILEANKKQDGEPLSLWGALDDNDEEWTGGAEGWEAAAAGMENVSDMASKLGNQVGMMLVNQFDSLGEAIGKFATGAEGSFRGLGDAIMQNLGNILIMMAASIGPAGLPLLLAGIGLQLGGGILRGLGNKSTGSTVGNQSGGGRVDFKISGNNLVGVLDRQNYSNNMNT